MTATYFAYATPIGTVTIACLDQAISRIAFGHAKLEGECRASALSNRAANQLQQYLAGKRTLFDLPLHIEGTDFQKAVWDAVLKIPYGQTKTYSEIAAEVGSPKATRAVGLANNRNPLPIVIPCHRVVGANGKSLGYAGGLKVKEYLLRLEAGGSR